MSPAPSDFSSVNAATLTGTRYRFTVAAETTAYARVRAVSGNLVSDWGDVVAGLAR